VPARRRLPIFRSVIAALLSLTGAAWLARGLIGLAGPSYYAPVAMLDFAAVWVMSVALLLSAGSFAGLLRDWRSPDRPVSLAAVTGIGGAAAAGIGNALEDALGIDVGWMLYVIGAIGTLVALVALGALALRGTATDVWPRARSSPRRSASSPPTPAGSSSPASRSSSSPGKTRAARGGEPG